MKILLSLYLLFLSFVPLSKPTLDGFYENVSNSYNYYENYENINTENYELTIIRGLINNKAYYGIYFNSLNGTNDLQIIYEDTRYSVSDKDKDGSFVIVSLRSDNIYELVLRSDGKDQVLKKLEIFLPSSVDKDKMIVGEGNGPVEPEFVLVKLNSPIVQYAIYVSIAVICFSVLIIFLLFIFRKGFFNKEKRKMRIVNTMAIYNSKSQALNEDDLITPVEEPTDEVNEYIREENYSSDNKEYEVTDIKEYLKSYGFNTNYSSLSDEEKNQIMLRLMFLKDNHKISLDNYYEETKQLWKK